MRSAQGTATTTSRSIGSSMAGMAKTIGLGFGAFQVGQFLGGAIKEAEEAEKVGRQTAAVIKSTGGAAKVSAAHIGKLADKFAKLAGVDDEAIQASTNWLLTFKNIKNVGADKIFDRTSRAAVNLAATLGAKGGGSTGDNLASAFTLLGKAVNDPIAGLTALGRAGVTFTQAQKDQIAALVASGDALGAQKIILQEVETQVNGSAAAQKTASGEMSVAWENLKETVGTSLMPAFQSVVAVLTDIFEWVGKNKDVALPLLGLAFVALLFAINPVVGALALIIGYMAVIRDQFERNKRFWNDTFGKSNAPGYNPNYSEENPYKPPAGSNNPPGVYTGATGGRRSGLTWVGERGAELVDLPPGSFVHNNRESMAMAGGGGMMVVVNVGGSVISEGRLIDKIHEGLLKKKRKSGSLDL